MTVASQADYNAESTTECSASYAYNGRGFLTDLQNTGSDGSILSEFGSTSPEYAMTYDASGNRVNMAVNVPVAAGYSGNTTYAYDSKNELLSENSSRNGSYSNSFAYDAAENPTEFRGASIPSANNDNQSVLTDQLVYDGNGNPTTYSGQSLTFDASNRMTSYGSVETNAYNPDGFRAWKQGISRTYYLYDKSAHPICELTSSGSISATNTFANGKLISRNASGDSTFYCFDPQGNVSQRVEGASGAVVTCLTDAFGATSSSYTSDPFGYCAEFGYYFDAETNLYLLSHRFYDSTNGRFINRDPISYNGGPNLYAYCGNDSANKNDPTGFMIGSIANCNAEMFDALRSAASGNFDGNVAACDMFAGCMAGLLQLFAPEGGPAWGCILGAATGAAEAFANYMCSRLGCKPESNDCLLINALVDAAVDCFGGVLGGDEQTLMNLIKNTIISLISDIVGDTVAQDCADDPKA